jgi:hypothetical protein
VDDRNKKNQCHQFLVHWKGHPEHEASWESLAHLAGSQEFVKEDWYQKYDSEVPFKFLAMARKPTSYFVAQLPAMIPIDSELNPVGFCDTMQDSEYESQNEIEYPIDTTLSWNWQTPGFANIISIFFYCNCLCLEFFETNKLCAICYLTCHVMLCFCFIWGICNGILYPLWVSITY